MKRITKAVTLVMLFALGACASQRGWTPTVDTANDSHANMVTTDLAQCKQLADKAADANETLLERGGIGTVGGAAGGALIGAMVGAPAVGAGLGAATGAGLGLGSGAIDSDAAFRKAYINCMKQRGHTVIN